MDDKYCRWLVRVLSTKALETLLPAMILDQDNRQLAIGLVTPDTDGDRRSFWPDSPTIPDSLVAHAAILRYEDGREVKIFDVYQCQTPFPPLHLDFRIRS
jgi:hypothetical protein